MDSMPTKGRIETTGFLEATIHPDIVAHDDGGRFIIRPETTCGLEWIRRQPGNRGDALAVRAHEIGKTLLDAYSAGMIALSA